MIFTFFPNFVFKNSKVLILDPMYGEYAHILEHIIGAKVFRHRLEKSNGFQIDGDKLLQQVQDDKPDMVVLVNPNSPTGKYFEKQKMLKLIRQVPESVLIVIDETYLEYVSPVESFERISVKRKNLVIIKSMSKVFALSGVRVGYVVANNKIVDKIAQFTPPWPVSLAGQISAVEAIRQGLLQKKILANSQTSKRIHKKITKNFRAENL